MSYLLSLSIIACLASTYHWIKIVSLSDLTIAACCQIDELKNVDQDLKLGQIVLQIIESLRYPNGKNYAYVRQSILPQKNVSA